MIGNTTKPQVPLLVEIIGLALRSRTYKGQCLPFPLSGYFECTEVAPHPFMGVATQSRQDGYHSIILPAVEIVC